MEYLATIAESLSVLCNPVWVVDSNKEWMRETQSLIVKHQRLTHLVGGTNSAYSSGETLPQSELVSNDTKYAEQTHAYTSNSRSRKVSSEEDFSAAVPNGKEGSALSPERATSGSNVCLLATLQSVQEERKYSLFDDSAWLEFPRLEAVSCSGGPERASDATEDRPRSREPSVPAPCRNDPAAWASWMPADSEVATGAAAASAAGVDPTTAAVTRVADLLQQPASDQEVRAITASVLQRPGAAEQRLQRALADPQLRKLWHSDDSPDAGSRSPDGRAAAAAKPSEATYAAAVAGGAGGGQERLSWPQVGASAATTRHRSSASWAAAGGRSDGGPGPGRYGAPPAQPGPQQRSAAAPAAAAPAQPASFAPVTSFSVTATYTTSPVLMPVMAADVRRLEAASSLVVAMPQGSLVIPALAGVARRPAGQTPMEECGGGGAGRQQQQPAAAAGWPERSAEWYSLAGWQYPSMAQSSAASRFTAQGVGGSGVPQYQSLKSNGQSTFIPPQEGLVPSQYAPFQVVGPTVYTPNKGLPPVPYPSQAMTAFAKYAAQPSHCLSAAHQPITKPWDVDADAYKNLHMMFCQKAAVAGLPGSNRGQFRSSMSDSTIRALDAQGKVSSTSVTAASEQEAKSLDSPRAPPTHATFEDFLHLLGVSDGNNNDLFELWRIGQVGGSSGPPSTELSPRSDTLTPTAAASTPRDVNAAAAAPGKLRRTKSLGSLPSVPTHQQPVTSSASKDSVTRRFDELEFLAIEQYESSDSLSRRFSDLERQALEQYTLLSQQGSRETLSAASAAAVVGMHQTPANVGVLPTAPTQAAAAAGCTGANPRPAQPRANTGGKPRKRRGKKKARELVIDTGIPHKSAWRLGSVSNPAPCVSASGSGWSSVAVEDVASRRVWPAVTQACVVDGKHPAAVGAAAAAAASVSYKAAVQHTGSQASGTFQGSVYAASEYAGTAAGAGVRLPPLPPPFSTPADGQKRPPPAATSMPAGLLNVGPLGPQARREALAHAVRMPSAPLMWPQRFSSAPGITGRSEAPGRTQRAKSGQDAAAADVETSCVLQ